MRKSFHKANTHFSHLTCIAVQTSESNLSSVAFCNEYTFLTRLVFVYIPVFFCIFACHEFESRTLSLVELNRVTQFHFYCVFFMPISSFSNVCFSVSILEGFVYLLSIYASDVWVLKNPASLGWLTTVYPTNILQHHKVYTYVIYATRRGKWRLVF